MAHRYTEEHGKQEVTCGERLVHSGMTRDCSRPGALLQALFQGLTYASFSNCIHIFLPDSSISASIFCTSKHPLLSLSRSIIDQMITFLSSHALHRVDLFRYSIKWSGLPGKMVMDNFTDQEQCIVFPIPPTLSRSGHCVFQSSWFWSFRIGIFPK